PRERETRGSTAARRGEPDDREDAERGRGLDEAPRRGQQVEPDAAEVAERERAPEERELRRRLERQAHSGPQERQRGRGRGERRDAERDRPRDEHRPQRRKDLGEREPRLARREALGHPQVIDAVLGGDRRQPRDQDSPSEAGDRVFGVRPKPTAGGGFGSDTK